MSKSRYKGSAFEILISHRVISKKSVTSVMNERQLLSFLKNPYSQFKSSLYPYRFIVNMLYAFQDRENLYLFMDFLSGGDLRLHLSRQKKFTEDQTSIIKYPEFNLNPFIRVFCCINCCWT